MLLSLLIVYLDKSKDPKLSLWESENLAKIFCIVLIFLIDLVSCLKYCWFKASNIACLKHQACYVTSLRIRAYQAMFALQMCNNI